MKIIVLSCEKCIILCYVLYFCLFLNVACFNPELSDIKHNYSKEDMGPLFDKNQLWNSDDIPVLNRKIFKGIRVTIREHPYVASVRRNMMHYCVASMVTKNLFLTVAHPLAGISVDELAIVVGENYADRGAVLLDVTLIVIHEHFDPYTLGHDIALVRVYENSQYRSSVKSIQLIHPLASLDSQRAFVTGWGRCDRSGYELCLPRTGKYTPGEWFDPMLRSVNFMIKNSNQYCEDYKQYSWLQADYECCKALETSGLYFKIKTRVTSISVKKLFHYVECSRKFETISKNGVKLLPGMLCLGTSREEDRFAPCLAVPGAPLVVNGHLAGILSWGYGCGYINDLPLVYTSVQYFQPWIVRNVPILRLIPQEDLKLLFEAKRAYVLTKYLNMTRVKPSPPFNQSDKPLEMLQLDKTLSKLRGFVYDIRDFLLDGSYHRQKLQMYGRLRHKNYEKEYISDLAKTVVTEAPKSFLDVYSDEEISAEEIEIEVAPEISQDADNLEYETGNRDSDSNNENR